MYETENMGGHGHGLVYPSRVLSNESLTSGYNTDQYNPVDTDTMDTEDYELWERRIPENTRENNKRSPGVTRSRRMMRNRGQYIQV